MAIPLWTTEGVNSTPHRARVTHANIFSRVAQGPDKGVRSQCCSFLLSFLEQSSSRALVMSHTWLDRALFLLPHSTPSSPSLLDLPNRTKPCAPPQGPMFGRFAEQSPFTGYEPNAPVEDGSTDVTTVLLPSRKPSIGSTYNSGEDMVTTPAVSEVDERSTFGNAGFTTVNTGERHVQHHSEFITLRESSETRSSHVRTSTGRPVATCSHTRKSSRDPNVLQESYSERERILSEHRKSAISLNCELIMLLKEEKLLYQDSLKQISYEIASWGTKESCTVWSSSPWIRSTA